ncbi:hypothetical protein BJ322DRAFT_1209534 [Thelephora terrestris]|uniref:Yeast cell wall synthesis Kre9/Knh1-like N-terminal domain-containing protein n=1 Tax=Thelephora terrestris TaxID=56493 RepID=A0A9P6HJX3_9AGAM|nr:hypothetical protein BJ322DRAFT_1209534 [Thelephora terrestris]
MTCVRLLLIVPLVFGGALGSLYPTSPVAGTVYDAGRQNLVEWIDDDLTPHLQEISVLKVDLYHNDDEFVSTLATGVDPLGQALNVEVPPDIANSDRYYLQITCEEPPLAVYSAYFTIQNSQTLGQNSTDSTSTLELSADADGVSTVFSGDSQSTLSGDPLSTRMIPNMTGISWVSPTATPVSSSSQNIAFYPTSIPPNFEPTASRNAARGSVDWKFRFVFILWPSLFGLIMAL